MPVPVSMSFTQLPLLQVRSLAVRFHTNRGPIRAVQGVDLVVQPGEGFGLVGESGSGKSATALAVMRLIEPPGGVVEGEILFGGIPVLRVSEAEIDSLRGSRMAMIFQGPQAC